MRKMHPSALAQLIKALRAGATTQELVEATGLHYVTVLHYVRSLRLAGQAFVTEWREDSLGRLTVPVLELASERVTRDAHRPPALTATERMRLHRDRKARGAAHLQQLLSGTAAQCAR